ncbi:ThiF family adenylyltransferase [Citrobacter braakii]|uniref:HesA/MoeB/ThiF family protein n=1 Tax=Citrobacter braakii TaxID=57706 RepID=UPI0023B2EF8B|nr:ThiF family adenylyltransferase [Citrobacter braakii]MDE9659525.1 ThiF family adenylyltransferase [Citrobacter braakii]
MKDEMIQRGISALTDCLGADNASALLRPAELGVGEAAAFYFPLPVDYTGLERRLRIGFPNGFPSESPSLQVEPSPWLVWPHAMASGLCLHGFREKPVTGSPEKIVQDSLSRFASIVSFSLENADPARRETEFQNEIFTYWLWQLKRSARNLMLLGEPESGSVLYVVSDPRYTGHTGLNPVWVSSDKNAIRQHFRRATGRSVVIRSPHEAGFFVKLTSFPGIKVPEPHAFLEWLAPHISEESLAAMSKWSEKSSALLSRWVVMALPGGDGAARFTVNLCTRKKETDRTHFYGLRSSRRQSGLKKEGPPASILSSRVNIIDRGAFFSRDRSNTAKTLENSHVVFVGVGSLGSAVSVQLAKAGLGRLTLIDPDRLESPNLGRHMLGAEDLGKFKSQAMRHRLLQDLPVLDVTALDTYIEWVMGQKPDIFEGVDLVIITTADWESESVLWEKKASGAKWGLIQAWSEPHTLVGHALIAPEGCFDARYLFSDRGDFRHRFTDWPDGGVVPLPACGESFIPGGSAGMNGIATMVTQAAIRYLTTVGDVTQWHSSVYRPDEAGVLGGRYTGPVLPEGVVQSVFERNWPKPGQNA